jgi:signal transduction histidine kinase
VHSLLKRQIRRFFGDPFSISEEWRGFVDAVNAAYREFDADRGMLERALDLSSQELLQANSEMRAVFQAIPDLLFRLDHEGVILECKAGVTTDLLFSPKELYGKRIQDIPFSHVGDKFRDAICQVHETQSIVSLEYSLVTSAGEQFYEARLLPLLENQIIVIIRNITERKRAEIENERLLVDLQHRGTQLLAAAEVSKSASTLLDPDELMNQTVHLIRERFDLYYVGIFLVDETGQSAVLRAGTGEAGQQMLEAGHRLVVGGESMIGWSIANAQARLALDVGAEAIRFNNPYLPRTRSEMALPLIGRNRVLGALTVQSAQEAAFSTEDIITLQTMVDQLTIAIENARLYQETRRRVSELAALMEIDRDISASLDLQTVLERIVVHARNLVGADDSLVYLLEPDGQTLRAIVALGQYAERSKATPLRLDESVIGDVVQTGNAKVIHHAAPDLRTTSALEALQEPLTVMCAPLLSKGKVTGVMVLDRVGEHGSFNQPDLDFLIGLSGQATIAIENAQMYAREQQRAAELASALEQQRELDRLKNEFIQNVSHELRTPLAIVRGYAELLASGDLGQLQPEQQPPADIIARRARMLSNLMDDLTAILEVETQGAKQEPVDLAELVHALLADFQVAAKNAGLTLAAEVAPDLPLVSGDPNHLRRVLDNLFGNAFKFTPAGGSVTLCARREGPNVVLKVTDTGVGIPSDKLDRIFERFYQVDGSTTRRYGGVGLGLALVKEIVEAHGGHIVVESEAGRGSVFTVTWPVLASPGQAGQDTGLGLLPQS